MRDGLRRLSVGLQGEPQSKVSIRTGYVISVTGNRAVVSLSGVELAPMPFLAHLSLAPGQNVRIENRDNVPLITGVY